MIYDSPEQKAFILECVKKLPTTYEAALQFANLFGQAIQDGQIIPIKDQPKPKAPPAPPAPPGKPKGNGNRKERRAAEKSAKATVN